MLTRTYSRTLKTTSAITLAFFLWSFGPIWQAVAFAATPKGQGSGVKGQVGRTGVSPVSQQTSGDRFEKAIEDIREKVGKADDKAGRGEAAAGEIEAIKAKRSDIDKLDIELKKEFAATEKKLKDAKLPKEILDRHYKFVKHYEDNLTELKTNLTGIEQGAESKGFKEALKKTKAHLEKVKAPRKHVPLDPNKLPNRMVKAKARAPRLKKEEFEKDFPPQRHQGTKTAFTTDSHGWTRISDELNSAFRNAQSEIHRKPILVAANGPLTGLLSSNPEPVALPLTGNDFSAGINSAATFLDSQSAITHEPRAILLAASALDLPTSDDLSETPEVQFTPEIQALATQLNHNPVKIYEWVRNNIEFVPTYGSIQGAQMTLETKMGNSFDTASLFIALLRASGISARYVYGTVEIPIEKAMNWVGGVTDPKMAGTVLATNGIPAKVLISGGTIKAVQLEHVWVKVFVDYIPSRGAVHKQGDTWIPLDASFKQYTYTQGIDIQSAVPFDAQSFANQIQSTATINPDGSVTNVNSALVQQTMQDYQTQVQNYIQQNYPNATVGDVIGKKEIVKQEFPILLGTLPYKTVQVGSEFATVPDNLRETMSFSIPDPTGAGTGLFYTISMPQLAGKKITLSFSPATANDQAVIESLLPQPNSDGTPIQLSQLPSSFRAYLINLKPELRVDGQVVATGSSATMGGAQSFTMSLNEPGFGMSNIDNIVQAGEYFGIGVDTGKIGAERLNALKTKLNSTKAKLETGIYDGLTKDDIVGDILYTTIASYFAELDAADEIAARAMNIIRYRVPSVGMFSLALNINETFGMPTSAGPKGMMIDVDRIMQAVFSKDGNMNTVKRHMLASGANSSTLEHSIPEQLFSTTTNTIQGISAIKTLSIANDQGVPIYTINQSNINTILPLLELSGDVKTDIQNAVNAGKVVTVQKTNITYNGWTGCGYTIIDPNTGASAFMISGGLNGGGFMYWFWTVMWVLAWIALIVAIGILIAALAPEIAVALSGIVGVIGQLSAALSELVLNTSIFLASYGFIRALYSTLMAWAAMTPPPMPIPTDPVSGGIFLLIYFRVFVFFEYLRMSRNVRPVWYWSLTMNSAVLKHKTC